MSLTAAQIQLIQADAPLIVANADAVAEIFYATLFSLDPSLRPMFKGNMREQGRKLMTMIATAIGNLERLDSIIPAVANLGARHMTYGVKDEHYHTVGAALIQTLETTLPAFNHETREAWVTMYGLLVSVMTTPVDSKSDAA
jgi:hemoglobin-like flavoprotein